MSAEYLVAVAARHGSGAFWLMARMVSAVYLVEANITIYNIILIYNNV